MCLRHSTHLMGSIIVGERRFYDDVDDSHCAINLFIFYVSALLYALFLHIYEPDVDIFAVPVSPILHLGLVADVVCTSSMTMLTTVIVQLTYLFFTCLLYCMLLFVHI